MAALKVYGIAQSQPVRAVLWACAIHNVPYTLVKTQVGSAKPGGTKSPEFLKLNPVGTIPTIDDNGFVLWESSAILAYLGEKHKWTSYYPSNIEERARVNMMMSWNHRNTRELTLNLFAPIARSDLTFEQDVVEKSKKQCHKILTDLNGILQNQKFVALDRPTVADLLIFEEVGQCMPKYCNIVDFGPYSAIQRWLEDMHQLPEYDKIHASLERLGAWFRNQVENKKSKL